MGKEEDEEYLKQLEIQRKHFEAQFGSLESMGFEDKSKTIVNNSSDDSDDDSNDDGSKESESYDDDFAEVEEEEFHGFSDNSGSESEENESVPKVITFKHNTKLNLLEENSRLSKLNRKGKIPSLQSIEIKEKLKQIEVESEILKSGGSKEDMENLQNDIELQRLLSESHILSTSKPTFSGAEVTLKTIDEDPIGKTRAKTLNQRLRSISTGDKKLEKMPMSMRKGMLRKEIHRVEKFEKEAKNSGTVLSKVKKFELRNLNQNRPNKIGIKSDLIGNYKIGKKQLKDKNSFREKGLQFQSIGKSTRNGLKISEKAVASMLESGTKKGKKKGRR